MSKVRSRIEKVTSSQGSLFDTGMSEGSLDIILGLKQLMSRLITASGKDRYLIAAEISRLTLRDLSKEMLDKITSSDPAYQPSAIMLVAFGQVVGCKDAQSYILEPVGLEVVSADEMKFMKLARLEEQRRRLEQEIMTVRKQCGIH